MRLPSIWFALFALASPLALQSQNQFGPYYNYAMAVDPSGNIWLTGSQTSGRVCFTYGSPPITDRIYYSDAVLIELDPTGSHVLKETRLTSDGDNSGMAIAADPAGNIYVAGYTTSSKFPVTPGAFQTKYGGGNPFNIAGFPCEQPAGDVFVMKIRPDTSVVYATYIGGSQNDVPSGIQVDSSGAVYLGGTSLSPDLPVTQNTLGVPPPANSSTAVPFFLKLNPAGSQLVYSSFFNSTINDIAFDTAGNMFLTGSTAGPLPVTPGAAQPRYGGGSSDGFALKLDPVSGKLIYATYLGGQQADVSESIVVDSQGFAWVGGYTSSSDFPAPGNSNGAFLVKLSQDGSTVVTALAFGGTPADAYPLATDLLDNVYVGGGVQPAGFTPTANAVQPTPCPSSQANLFLMQLSPGGAVTYASYYPCDLGEGLVFPIGTLVFRSPGTLAIYTANGPITIQTTTPQTLSFTYPANAASFARPNLAPGEIVSIFGTGLGPAQAAGAQPDPTGHMPILLGGTEVSFNGIAAPLLYASATQINAVVPLQVSTSPGTTATVQVSYNGQNTKLPASRWPRQVPASSLPPAVRAQS